MYMERERLQIVEYGKKMSASGLSRGTSGNLSIYDPETGYMAISPSGIGYFETEPEDVVILDLAGRIIEGSRKPSSEAGMHAAFYRARPELRAVVHTHSTFCTVLACLHRPIEALHYVIADTGADTVPCAPYALFGTPELAEAAVAACGAGNAVLLANHGMVACGQSLAAAFSLAENVEALAELQWRCLCAGGAEPLSTAQMAEVRERFKTYGQSSET